VSKKNVDSMQKKLQTLQRQMMELGPLMRGSVVRIGTKSKQFYFSLNKDKKTRLIYLGEKRVALARQYSDNYKKLLCIVEKMTILNMEKVKQSGK
jgi:site-specific recombinase XerD